MLTGGGGGGGGGGANWSRMNCTSSQTERKLGQGDTTIVQAHKPASAGQG